MKFLAIVALLGVTVLHADIPPRAGTVSTTEITEGASILGSYLRNDTQALSGSFPSEIGTITIKNFELNQGHYSVKEGDNSKTIIACVGIYDRGRHYKCKLYELFK